ncbi:retrovirus-related pol polyprotein from transposon TNT 1-94 [Tanacetum coccineum]
MKEMYCLVVTYDYSRFSWVFFLATKDETSGILKSFITRVENLIDQRVKVIMCDNGTEFNNEEMNQFCERKGIKREFSIARTPQQNGAEAVNTACYVQNRVLVTKPHNKTLYKLFLGRKPALGFIRPFGCLVIILNTIDHLGKFDGKTDEGFFSNRTRIVEENLHIQFSENTPNIIGSGPNWLFDIDALTNSKSSPNDGSKPSSDDGKKVDENPRKESELNDQEKEDDIVYSDDDEDVGTEADTNNLDAFMPVNPIPTTRVHKDHPVDQIIEDLNLAPQTIRLTKNLEEHGLFSSVQQRTNHKDFQNCLFACFLSQEEPKKVIHALKDPSWVEAMQEEVLQFKLQEV